jgi:hypothetical protein
MSILLNITQDQFDLEVTGIDEFISIIGVEVAEHLEIGDNKFNERLDNLMYLINIRNALAFYDVDSIFLTQAEMRYLIEQAKKVVKSIGLPDNSIYQ